MNAAGSGIAPEILEALGRYAAERTNALAIATLDERGGILAANAPLERLAGRALAGTAVEELVLPAQRATLEQALASDGTGWQQRLLGLAADERGVPVDFTLSLQRISGGWLLVAEPAEVTIHRVNEHLLALNDELARAQRQIGRQNAELSRQNAMLRELDQLKDELLASVSHDLRTPLTAILGYAELMRRRGGLGERHTKSAIVIERNARRLLRLVDGLLLLAQARAGKLQLDRQPVDLAELAADTLEWAAPLAEQETLRLEPAFDRAAAVIVEGDRLRLGQLLDNLVGNAVKFTPAGGQVTVSIAAEGDHACLAVADSGPGIAEAERARLFDAFERGTTVSAPGTGLGLAIVREVADAHGATITLETAPGRGTRFTVRLPLA